MLRKEIDNLLQFCTKPVAFHPALARVLGNDIAAALFFQQIIFWSDKGSRDDGWIYKTDKEIEIETTLTPRMCIRIRKLLREKELIEVKVMKGRGGIPMNHYKINGEAILKCVMGYYKVSQPSISEITTETGGVSFQKTQSLPPKRRRTYITPITQKVIDQFTRKCVAYVGSSPVIGVKDHALVTFALNTGGLSEGQVMDLVDEWFDSCPPDMHAISIGRALSRRRIERYKVDHGIM